jgi:predicted DNA-binding transcriptional regulator YafY
MPTSPGKASKTHLGASKPMIERCSALLGLLQTKGAATSRADLAKHLKRHGYQASVRTVQRDIDFLKQQGHDIIHSKNGGYSCKGTKDKLRGLLSSKEEMLPSLVLMRGMLNMVGKLDPSSGADVLLSHASDLLEKQGMTLGDLGNYISSTALPMSQRLVPMFRTLVKGVIEKRETRILYKGNKDKEPRSRVIRPYHLFECEGRWYCIAHCCEAKAIRTFVQWRIDKAELLDETFKRPAKLDNPKTWERQAKIFGVWSTEDEPMRIRLKMSGYAARLVQEAGYRPAAMEIEECKDEEGAVEVRFQSHAFEDILPWILRWGPYCKVLAPSTLVRKMQTHVRRIAGLYEEPT